MSDATTTGAHSFIRAVWYGKLRGYPLTGAWRGTERLGRCIEAMLPKASLPRGVQHRWALRQATQCPPGIYSGLKSS